MRSRLLSSSLWAITGNGTQFTVVFLLLIYLAHILDPHAFGLMATVSVGLDLGTRIARWGQVELLQQDRYGDDASRNQSLAMSLLLALVFSLAFVAAAEPLARAYAAPELATMMWLCAPVFLFSATGSTPEAVLRKQHKFKLLAFRNTVGTLVGAAVAILFVNLGYGPLTLAIQRLVQAIVAGLWTWTAIDWRPSWRLRGHWSPAMAREGGHVMVGSLLATAAPRLVDLMVGFLLGPATLGLMRVAFRINEFVGQMVVMPLVSVASAELSATVQDLERMRRTYLRLVQASAILMCPALVGLSLVAQEAIPFLFGHKWIGAIPFVQVIGLLSLVAPVNYYFSAAMVSLGQSNLAMRQAAWQLALGVAMAAVAAQYSLLAIAVAHVVRGTIVSGFNVRDLKRYMGLPVMALARDMAVPYLATAGMAAMIVGARFAISAGLPNVERLAILVCAGGLGYGVTLRLMAGVGLWPDYALLSQRVFGMLGKRRPRLG